MSLGPDPYRTLGLSRGATVDEIRRAYRRLAKANHPDAAGAASLPRFLAIQAAYEQLVEGPGAAPPGGRAAPTARGRSSSANADANRTDATRRAYGGRPREARPGTGPAGGGASGAPRPGAGAPGGRTGAGRPGDAAPNAGSEAGARRRGPGEAAPPGATDDRATGRHATGPGSGADPNADPSGGTTRTGPARGKATLGSTSYDGADAGPFEPDWGGASWYGTTSGTYWTINPKEYADPRKHGPEYQARARRQAGPRGAGEPGRDPGSGPSGSPTHTTSSWWESTSGPEADASAAGGPAGDFGAGRAQAADAADTADPEDHRPRARTSRRYRTTSGAASSMDLDESAPDPARAAVDLGRALTDPRSGGLRGRALRAAIGWLPIALGIGWLVGELTGCGRFAATCDPAVAPLAAVGQLIVLAALLLLPEIAAVAAGAALVLLAAATAASLILSATGSAADEGSRRAALGALLVVAWLSGLAISVVRRVRSGSRPARPVS